jgi:hypothetical protein
MSEAWWLVEAELVMLVVMLWSGVLVSSLAWWYEEVRDSGEVGFYIGGVVTRPEVNRVPGIRDKERRCG